MNLNTEIMKEEWSVMIEEMRDPSILLLLPLPDSKNVKIEILQGEILDLLEKSVIGMTGVLMNATTSMIALIGNLFSLSHFFWLFQTKIFFYFHNDQKVWKV